MVRAQAPLESAPPQPEQKPDLLNVDQIPAMQGVPPSLEKMFNHFIPNACDPKLYQDEPNGPAGMFNVAKANCGFGGKNADLSKGEIAVIAAGTVLSSRLGGRPGGLYKNAEGVPAGAGRAVKAGKEAVAGERPVVKDQGYWAKNGRPDIADLLHKIVNASPNLEVQALHFEAETGKLTIRNLFTKQGVDLVATVKDWANSIKQLGKVNKLEVTQIGTRHVKTGIVEPSAAARDALDKIFPLLPKGIQEAEKLAADGLAKHPDQVVAAIKWLKEVEGLNTTALAKVENIFFQAFLKTVYATKISTVKEGIDNLRSELTRVIAESGSNGTTQQLIVHRYATLEKLIMDYLHYIGLK